MRQVELDFLLGRLEAVDRGDLLRQLRNFLPFLLAAAAVVVVIIVTTGDCQRGEGDSASIAMLIQILRNKSVSLSWATSCPAEWYWTEYTPPEL